MDRKHKYFGIHMSSLKTCKGCNKEFITKCPNHIFCCYECCNKYHKEKLRILKTNKPKKISIIKYKRKGLLIKQFNCKMCNQLYINPPYWQGREDYRTCFCSDMCMKKYYKTISKNINKINKLTVIKPYNNKIIFEDLYDYDKKNFGGNRIWVLIRDDFKCQKCGSEENLTVHHKDGKGFAVEPKHRNNNIFNLITLCKKCHNNEEDENIKIENYIDIPRLKNRFII